MMNRVSDSVHHHMSSFFFMVLTNHFFMTKCLYCDNVVSSMSKAFW